MKKIWQLITAFFSIGLFTFGGGYAMLPMLQKEVVEKHKWATADELLDSYAIAQCTPGVIAVNTATYIGAKVAGVLGSAAATIAVVLPSLMIISIIAMVLKNFMEYQVVAYAFSGIRVAVAVLVTKSLIGLFKKGVKGAMSIGVFLAVLVIGIFTDISPIVIVVCSVLLGIGTYLFEKRSKKEEQK